jgi:hypothetical protein
MMTLDHVLHFDFDFYFVWMTDSATDVGPANICLCQYFCLCDDIHLCEDSVSMDVFIVRTI